jgi:hypothetical protein
MVDDYLEALSEVKVRVSELSITDQSIETFDDLKEFIEIVDERFFGTLKEVIERLKELLLSNHEKIPAPPDGEVQIGLIPDATAANSFLVVMWRINLPKGGLNIPYVLFRRSASRFELMVPPDEFQK